MANDNGTLRATDRTSLRLTVTALASAIALVSHAARAQTAVIAPPRVGQETASDPRTPVTPATHSVRQEEALPPPPPPPPGAEAVQSASAEPAQPPPRSLPADTATQPPPAARWYGGQTLAVDGASITLLYLSTTNGGSTNLAAIGGAGYLLGAPFVHAVHHNWLGLASLGLRISLPFVGALAGARMQNCSNVRAGDFCGLDGAESGLLLGGIAAVLLDASALAYEPQKPSKQSGRRLLVGPMIGDGHRGLSLAGTF